MLLEAIRLSTIPVLLAWAVATGAPELAQSLRDAALTGQAETVRSLLAKAKPADRDAVDARGWNALMYAVKGGHGEIVRMLLEAGASVDGRDDAGETALHLAARYGRARPAELLLRAGADLEARDSEGRSALYRAIERHSADVIELLQAAALAKAKGALSLAATETPDQTLPPRIIEQTPAPYSETALAKGIEGQVVLMVLVRRDGSVGAVTVSKGLEASLDESAQRTVREWKFAPAMRNGRTVEVVLEVEVRFQLPDESRPDASRGGASCSSRVRAAR
jgi:TonB family protein